MVAAAVRRRSSAYLTDEIKGVKYWVVGRYSVVNVGTVKHWVVWQRNDRLIDVNTTIRPTRVEDFLCSC